MSLDAQPEVMPAAEIAAPVADEASPKPAIIIRRAELDDVPELVAMAADFIENGDYWGERKSFAPVDFARHLIALIQSPIAGFFVAETSAGELAGTIVHIVAHDIFTGGSQALKMHWFVKDGFGGLGLRLERHARRWAQAQGADGISMSAVNADAAELLERLGYQRTEALYHKAI